jgi:zinc protease
MARHAIELSRRGAGQRSRVELDEELDRLGASLEAGCTRDALYLSGLCLDRHLDRLVELAADVLAHPHMNSAEHHKLLRESGADLDEMRDDDSDLAGRFFAPLVAPGTRYGRTSIGTEATLAALADALPQVCAFRKRALVRENLVIGFAGAVDEARATLLSERLVAELSEAPAPPLVDVSSMAPLQSRRVLLVDKPDRTQSQVVFGHPIPAYGGSDFAALTAVETALGGTFTSRLVQKIRVENGWSYGCGTHLGRARGPLWLTVDLAPAAPVTEPALATAQEMFAEVAEHGITAAELERVQSYLTGSLPFTMQTARQRMRSGVQLELYGLPRDFPQRITAEIATLGVADVQAAARRWLHPEALATVVVATANVMRPVFENGRFGEFAQKSYDEY